MPKLVLIPIDTHFWSLVDKITDPYGCWIWQGSYKGQYGMYSFGSGNNIPAHILAYEFTYGQVENRIEDDLHFHHTCENPPCCNPQHIRPEFPGDHIRIHIIHRETEQLEHYRQLFANLKDSDR